VDSGGLRQFDGRGRLAQQMEPAMPLVRLSAVRRLASLLPGVGGKGAANKRMMMVGQGSIDWLCILKRAPAQ
jgi:hypothetical protein